MEENSALRDPAAERELIGALMRYPDLPDDVVPDVGDLLVFTDNRCALAYECLAEAWKNGDRLSVQTLRVAMSAAGEHGDDLLKWLTDARGDAPVLREDALPLRDSLISLARKRDAEARLQALLIRNRDPRVDADDAMTQVQGLADDLASRSNLGDTLIGGHDAYQMAVDALIEAESRDGLPGLSTGSKPLDNKTLGLQAGRLACLAGRPGTGKSVAALGFARAALKTGAACLLFSYEMGAAEIATRMIASEGSISMTNLGRGLLTRDEWNRVATVRAGPWERLSIDDEGGSINHILAVVAQQARYWRARGVKDILVIIDYVQLIPEPPGSRRDMSRDQYLGMVSGALKRMARKLGVSVVMLSQLRRHDGLPRMSDLRESGNLEQDADQVILLYKPDQDQEDERPGEIDFIVAKNRGGETGTVTLTHEYVHARVRDLDAANQPLNQFEDPASKPF